MNDEALLRYSRHIMLPEVDIAGQQALLNARVLVIGAGGLGSPVALYLAAAGVGAGDGGALHLADHDDVDLSNLQRQIAHTHERINQPKVASVAKAISALNPDTHIVTHAEQLQGETLSELITAVDVVCDCTDRFSSRFAINRECVQHGVPLVSGAAIRFSGQVSVFDRRQPEAPCYACLYPEGVDDEAMSCATSGVLAPLVGVVGSLQAVETLKLLMQVGQTLHGRLLTYDALNAETRTMNIKADPLCPCCARLK